MSCSKIRPLPEAAACKERKRSADRIKDDERRKYRKMMNPLEVLEINMKQQQRRKTALFLGQKCLNQFVEPCNMRERKCFGDVCDRYAEDVKTFTSHVSQIYTVICSVCGKRVKRKDNVKYGIYDSIFKPLQGACETDRWFGYFENGDEEYANCCSVCHRHLQKAKIPKFSRVNVPLSDVSDTLSDLNYLESLLLSPVLPMTNIWRHQNFGQYKSKGQCVAFLHDIGDLAKYLPRYPSEVVLDIDKVYGWKQKVRLESIRQAFIDLKFKYCHPSFANIEFSEANFKAIDEMVRGSSAGDDVNVNDQSENIHRTQGIDEEWSRAILDKGMNQYVENENAKQMLCAPIACDEDEPNSDILKNKILTLFNSLRNRTIPLHYTDRTTDWSTMFPTTMPSGRGGPSEEYIQISLREWLEYVIQIESLPFHRNIPFLFYGNFTLRKYKITGVSTCKPISRGVSNAISELVRITKSHSHDFVPENTIKSLANQVSFHTNTLAGSVGDMSQFRKNILSMISKHGAPTYFVTLSPADSFWPETFVRISGSKLTPEQARKLTAKDRSELLAANPVLATLAWKERLQSLINYLCNGKLKPLGKVLHYAIKSEWQTRCSEYAHILLWCDHDTNHQIDLDNVQVKEDFLRQVESHVSAWIPGAQSNAESTDTHLHDAIASEKHKYIEESVSALQSPPIARFHDFFDSTEKQEQIKKLITCIVLKITRNHVKVDFPSQLVKHLTFQ